jgi:hypothetical protein
VHHAHVRFFRPPANGRHTGPVGRPNGIRRRALLGPAVSRLAGARRLVGSQAETRI